jgi:hypothetical protein
MNAMRELFESQVLANPELDAADKLLAQAALLQVMPLRELYQRLTDRCGPERSVQQELEAVLSERGVVPFSSSSFDRAGA